MMLTTIVERKYDNHVHDPLYEYDEYENLNEYLCHGCP